MKGVWDEVLADPRWERFGAPESPKSLDMLCLITGAVRPRLLHTHTDTRKCERQDVCCLL